jgi:hypothetical protein
MQKVDIPTDDHDCWIWKGSKSGNSRPQVYDYVLNRPMHAARAMWIVAFSAIPDRKLVCHTCDNIDCVNPGHLFLGTYQDNVDDMIAKGRRPVGENRGGHKLKNAEVEAIKLDSRRQGIIAKEYGVHPSLISRIKSAKRRRVSK